MSLSPHGKPEAKPVAEHSLGAIIIAHLNQRGANIDENAVDQCIYSLRQKIARIYHRDGTYTLWDLETGVQLN